MNPTEIIMKFLLLGAIGAAALLATMVMADVGGDWMERKIFALYRKWQAAWIKAGWQVVAARHKRKVKA